MKRTRSQRIRLGVLLILMGLFFAAVTARLTHLQIFQNERYSRIVERQSGGTIGIPAPRGVIYDRRGQVVAKNEIASSLYAYPTSQSQINRIGAYLDRLFDYKKGTAAKKFSLRVRRFSWIDRMLDDDLAAKIDREAPEGLYLREESRRSYPFGAVGRQILGFTDIDNKGRSGLELSFEETLAGDSGIADIRRDGTGNTYRVHESALIQPKPGRSLVLTMDWRLQDIVEDELRNAVDEFNAQHGTAAFIDCATGDVLAMAHYDPQEKFPERPMKLRTVTDWFEPGSSFKAFVAAGLLDADIVDFNDTTYCEMGAWKLGRRTLHDDKELGWLTFREIIEHSSNIGIGKTACRLGGEELIATAHRFGFGQKLRCGLPGEEGGRLAPPNRWSEYTISALAMGHGVAVTTLQMANAFGAIANGGKLYRPRTVLGYVDEDGALVSRNSAELIGRAMQPESVDSLHAFLRGVVENGTAKPVNSPVISIAGKTGTGEMVNTETGRMEKNKFVASFGGYFPADKPSIAGIVVLFNPRPITYGGHTSGPTFRRIAERYAVVNPDLFSLPQHTLLEADEREEHTVEAPDFIGRDLMLARQMADKRGLVIRATAEQGQVIWQFPPADRLLFPGDEVLVEVEPAGDAESLVPDLTGLNVRTVSALMHRMGLTFRISGSGRVVKQTPAPGEVLNRSEICWLTCRPS
ncbi:PASTA domain-containing protein [bacterium]|nr:PASTA domain-containing protein [bacterium]